MAAPALPRGLTAAEAAARRAAHGPNLLTPPPRRPWWRDYLAKFDDPVIRILMVAAGVAVAVGAVDGHYAEGVSIVLAVLLATALAFWNEHTAGRAFDVLARADDDTPVKALRDGHYEAVPRRDVVVGDLLFLEAGDAVPADGTLVEAVGLLVDEGRLTGESGPARKRAGEWGGRPKPAGPSLGSSSPLPAPLSPHDGLPARPAVPRHRGGRRARRVFGHRRRRRHRDRPDAPGGDRRPRAQHPAHPPARGPH